MEGKERKKGRRKRQVEKGEEEGRAESGKLDLDPVRDQNVGRCSQV